VPSLGERDLLDSPGGEHSALVAQRVLLGNERARVRQGCTNAMLTGADVDRLCRPAGAVRQLLHSAGSRLGWSARAYHRVLRVARTIADLAGSERVEVSHVAEAVSLRQLDRRTGAANSA